MARLAHVGGDGCPMTDAQALLGVLSGSAVGFILGLVGGGGSILAVPLMVYVVGVGDPHVAIGTSACAVAASAGTNLVTHARAGTVRWQCASLYAAAGVLGALVGSVAGKAFDGQKLLALFAILMLGVGLLTFRGRGRGGVPDARCTLGNAPRIAGFGAGTGLLSGFFGIGGGFLIVPTLIAATDMTILNAVGSSLVAVTAFGITTAASYAISGLINWWLAIFFILGGVAGGFGGVKAAHRLAEHKGQLNAILATLICAVGLYVLWRALPTVETSFAHI
jgi:uncharacterized protein